MRHFVTLRLDDGRALGLAVDTITRVVEMAKSDATRKSLSGCCIVCTLEVNPKGDVQWAETPVIGTVEEVLRTIFMAQNPRVSFSDGVVTTHPPHSLNGDGICETESCGLPALPGEDICAECKEDLAP